VHLVAAADWQDVIIASLTFAGVVFNGLVVCWVARQTRTPSHRRLGELVEETHTITSGRVVEQLERIAPSQRSEGDTGRRAE